MKKIIAAAFALTVLGSGVANAAIVLSVGGHRPMHHRHQVCSFHHHHRVCYWR